MLNEPEGTIPAPPPDSVPDSVPVSEMWDEIAPDQMPPTRREGSGEFALDTQEVPEPPPAPTPDPTLTRRTSANDPWLAALQEMREMIGEVRRSVATIQALGPRLERLERTVGSLVAQMCDSNSVLSALMMRGENSVSELSGKVVLVVDDNTPFRRIVRRHLAEAGATPYSSRTVAAAMACVVALGHTRLDAALIDVVLPDGNGVELARRIVELKPECRIALITGDPQHQLQFAAAELGGVAVTKPIDLAGIRAALFPGPAE